MKFNEEYIKFVQSRLNKDLTAEEIFSQVRLLQGGIGLHTEACELAELYQDQHSEKEKLKEAGDIAFYLGLCFNYFNVPLDASTKNHYFPLHEMLVQESVLLLELLKKFVFQQRKDLEKEIIRQLILVKTGLFKLFEEEAIIEGNVSKLTKRYKTSFSVEDSKNREE